MAYTARRVGRIAAGVLVILTLLSGIAPGPAGAAAHRPIFKQLARNRAGEPQVCDGCNPPLTYQGGPVMSTTSAGMTVVPIFWAPAGYSFDPGFEQIIDGFLTNVAAASGRTSNAIDIATEYYQVVNGQQQSVRYQMTAAPPIADTDPFPTPGCKPDTGETACVTDAGLRSELQAVEASHGLPADLNHAYAMFFPPDVETQDLDGSTSTTSFCGYHRDFGTGNNLTIYLNMPYDVSGCGAGQSPNGNAAADAVIDSLSHELSEAMTDPADQVAWNDSNGNEEADMCSDFYGPPLGSTDPASPGSTEYNELINGGRYYIQEEFSNLAFKSLGIGKGCQQTEAAARAAAPNPIQGAKPARPQLTAFAEASPNTLPADGSSTSSIDLNMSDANGDVVQGDPVHFSVSTRSGSGKCGTLDRAQVKTNTNGDAVVTYRASASNVECWVQATDAEGGQVSESVIYQGSTQQYAPQLNGNFPDTVAAGDSATFTMDETNPSPDTIKNATIELDVYQGDDHSPNVDASQIQLSYSTTGPGGKYSPIQLSGNTGGGSSITGTFDAAPGQTLPPGFKQQISVRLSVGSSVRAYSGPLIALEAYMDVVNNANGSGDTIGDTGYTNVAVPGGVARSSGMSAAALGGLIGGVVLVVGALIGATLIVRRRRHRAIQGGDETAAGPE